MLRRAAGRGRGVDEVNERLVAHFLRHPPTEPQMARLSILQQTLNGTHGVEDYACTTLFLCAQQAIIDAPASARAASIQSIESFSDLETACIARSGDAGTSATQS